MKTPRIAARSGATNAEIQAYWDRRVHDTELSRDAAGSPGFFAAIDAYRYGKLDYLAHLADFGRWKDRDVLDLGCGGGVDLVRFARAGARVVGAELSFGSLSLAREYITVEGRDAPLVQADAARLPFRDESFDLVWCHGVLPFALDCAAIVAEIWRVARIEGLAVVVAYNRHSWMSALRAIAAVPPGHGDAPVFRMHTRRELDALVSAFPERSISSERLPARALRRLPERWRTPFGWHLVARCRKLRPGEAGGA